MKKSKVLVLLLGLSVLGCVAEEDLARYEAAAQNDPGLYPDLQTVIPQQLQYKKPQGGATEEIRFSNGVANTGLGDLRMRPEHHDGVTDAVQEILDADRNIVREEVVSTFEFHPAHNHWHIDNVAEFEIRSGSVNGPLVGSSVKTTFCLIDWYALDGNSNTSDRIYWDCATSFQGIQPGWVDQYHQSLPGMAVPITGMPSGVYFLKSTSNFTGAFLETDTTNNSAWVKFQFTRTNNSATLTILDHSPCDSPGMCGEFAPNR